MLLRAAHDRWRDRAGVARPSRRARPAPRAHQVAEGLTHGRRALRGRRGPAEPGSVLGAQRHQHGPGAQLRDPVVGRVQQLPARHVTQLAQPVQHVLAVGAEPVHAQPADVFQQQRPGLQPLAQLHRPGEQVTLVDSAQLPAGHGERRAWHAAREQVHSRVGFRFPDRPVRDVSLGHLPGRPVGPQRGAGGRIELDGQGVPEAGPLEPQRLPARSRADLDDFKILGALPAVTDRGSCRAAHAAPRWVPASLGPARLRPGLTVPR